MSNSRNIRPTALVLFTLAMAATFGSFSISAIAQTFTVTPPSPGCQLLSAPAGTTPAFCETFDAPAGTGNRSGQLNGTLWGVSRFLGFINLGQGMYFDVAPTTIQLCGASLQVIAPNDVQICDGQLVDSVWDQTSVTSLAMYPKQPFDIAGRTGTIAFDVSDDSDGNHAVWPELWYTDQPVPVPFVHEGSLQSVPVNGFGVRFAGACLANSGPGCGTRFICPDEPESVSVITVDSAVVINNYISNDSFNGGTISVQPVGCVVASSGPGNMNHFELRVSPTEIDVYGTDAGTIAPLKKIAVITNFTLGLTRGLVWLEDAHYNGNKGVDAGPPQGIHTFTWDNLAFDGPVLPRDLAFDVLDALTPVGPSYPGILNDGWLVAPTATAPVSLTVSGVYNIANAEGALLTFNFVDVNTANLATPVPFLSYRINSGSWQLAPWPFGPCPTQNNGPACGLNTIAVPVNLTDIQPGTNTIQFQSTDYAVIANVDLILRGAGGTACATNCPISTTTTLVSSKNPSIVGDSVTLTATVSSSNGAPTGTVTFSDSGTTLGSAALNSSGVAALTLTSLTLGTHTITAAYTGATGFESSLSAALSQVVNTAPPVVRFDWENGTLGNWGQLWGLTLSVANSTAEAYTGKHSLRMSVLATETHSAIANETPANLIGFNPGTTVTLHVYSTGATGAAVYPFAFDQNWIPAFGSPVTLAVGWNTVVYVIPAGFASVKGFGIQIDNPNAEANTLYLDTVTTQ
ncbi:MAG: Ig-like domain-containing protein [Terracidiphilus sp.]